MSKSLVDGLMRKILVAGEEIDIDQAAMTAVLLNEHKDGDGKWPDEFNNKTYQLLDSNSRYWKITLRVQKLKTANDFIINVGKKYQSNTFVMVYPLNPSKPADAKHCIYAEGYDPVQKEVLCINSDSRNPTPKISINYPGLIFYKVSCSVTEMTNGPMPPTKSTSLSTTVNGRSCSNSFSIGTVKELLYLLPTFLVGLSLALQIKQQTR